ncbi:hypothetical protein [Pseudobutyrivibrio sp.]|jgi:hypothetical protein|uniref:hypothetical protein n=1 Tax=Pseudobutyrivibrio sp. TaxID=2014367 RepID=UPI0025E28C50|nr:hypothetical protein [Pseudobutyrivibrio sp.]
MKYGDNIRNSNDFYQIVKEEGLDKYNIGDSKDSCRVANVLGIVEDSSWIVYETDERAAFHILSIHESKEKAYEELLIELRNRKRKEDIMKKIRRK